MACGGCAKRRGMSSGGTVVNTTNRVLFGKYKYLSSKQIEARLSAFKRKNCKDCDKRYICDYASFLICKGEDK